MMDEGYERGFWTVALPTFLLAWAYCWYSYGFLLGFGLGWFPAMILAAICGFLWPFVVLAVVGFGLFLFVF